MKAILKFKIISASFATAFFFVLGGWLWAYFALRSVNQPLVVHWSAEGGISQIGNIFNLFGFAALGLAITIVNFFLAMVLEERSWFLGKLVTITTLIMGILIFIGFSAIINVN